jgi:hypothetical protein
MGQALGNSDPTKVEVVICAVSAIATAIPKLTNPTSTGMLE